MDHSSFSRRYFTAYMLFRYTLVAALLINVLFINLGLSAQTPFPVNVPGGAFSPEWHGAKGTVTDFTAGRSFRGNSRTVLILTAPVRLHPNGTVEHKLQRLIVRFHTNDWGPTLQTVELRNGNNVIFQAKPNVEGNFTKAETASNMWIFKSPLPVNAQTVIQMQLQYSGGFEGPGTPGDFMLSSVELDYPTKLSVGTTTTANAHNVSIEELKKPGETRPPVTQEDKDNYTTIGLAAAASDSMIAAFRRLRHAGPRQSGFDMGIGITGMDKLWGPGKQWFLDALNPDEQAGFKQSAAFTLGRNNYKDLAIKGAEIAAADPEVAKVRELRRSGLFWLGFDIATGIYGDPALGAQGNTAFGPGAEKIRTTASEGERVLLATHEVETGFNASMTFHLARKYK